MPPMTGIEFLAAAIREFPDVRRVLLTAYADIEAAIGAIDVCQTRSLLTEACCMAARRCNRY